MNIQIFGVKKSHDTRKAEMYFKERHISYQFIDLNEKGFSKGELESIKNSIGIDNLIDKEGREYQKMNLKHMAFDPMELVLDHPLLSKIPIVRNGRNSTAGYCPDLWKSWKD